MLLKLPPTELDLLEPREIYLLSDFYRENEIDNIKQNAEVMAVANKIAVANAMSGKNHKVFDESKEKAKKKKKKKINKEDYKNKVEKDKEYLLNAFK